MIGEIGEMREIGEIRVIGEIRGYRGEEGYWVDADGVADWVGWRMTVVLKISIWAMSVTFKIPVVLS